MTPEERKPVINLALEGTTEQAIASMWKLYNDQDLSANEYNWLVSLVQTMRPNDYWEVFQQESPKPKVRRSRRASRRAKTTW